MISYEQALKIIDKNTFVLPKQEMPLPDLLGYVLAEDIVSRFDMPSFSNSAVDGYGVLVSDLENAHSHSAVPLKLIGAIKAGAADETILAKRFSNKNSYWCHGAIIGRGSGNARIL